MTFASTVALIKFQRYAFCVPIDITLRLLDNMFTVGTA